MKSQTQSKDIKNLRWAVFFCMAIALTVLLIQLIRTSSTSAQAGLLVAIVIVSGLVILSARVFDIRSFSLRKGELIADLEHRIEAQQSQLDIHRSILDKLIIFSMSGYIFGHLDHILAAQKSGQPYTVQNVDKVQEELKFLKDHGYIQDFNPNDIAPGRNVAEVIHLTAIAEWFVRLRLEAEQREEHLSRQSSRHS